MIGHGKTDFVYDAFRKAEILVLANEETELREFFKSFFYGISSDYKGTDALLYAHKLDLQTVTNANAGWLWSAEILDDETRKAVKDGAVLIEGKDIKQEYIYRFLSSCSI